MYLVYLDESGNSGLNLHDPQQPLFALCAMVVDEGNWKALESDLKSCLDTHFGNWKSVHGFEVHAADLRRGTGFFKDVSVDDRIAFRDEWMKVGKKHEVRLSFYTVAKKEYAQWLAKTFGGGIVINPHIVAFALLARCVDNYLQSLNDKPLGMFISDENKQVMADVEKSIRVLQGELGALQLKQIVEKGFFIDSSKSLPLQLCDLFALSLRKKRERESGLTPAKSIDDSGIKLAESLVYENNEHDGDVLDWLKKQYQASTVSATTNPKPTAPRAK
jgi:hypothetical protein